MYCVIQEIELKKSNKNGHPKELLSKFVQMSMDGQDISRYRHSYSEERFERPVKKAYKLSIHISYREKGKLKKKQYPLCTVNYYEIADNWFNLYDYCDKKITFIAGELGVDPDAIYDLVQAKIDPLIEAIQDEFRQSEEYKIHEEHERITTQYSINKMEFAKQYDCDKDEYDYIYDVFGNLMNKGKLDEIQARYKFKQEYEEKSRSYQEQYYSNYSKFFSGGGSSYSNQLHSNHSIEDKETLKQFYRELSKKFHPDANPDTDTSKQMQLLNQLKNEWGV